MISDIYSLIDSEWREFYQQYLICTDTTGINNVIRCMFSARRIFSAKHWTIPDKQSTQEFTFLDNFVNVVVEIYAVSLWAFFIESIWGFIYIF